MFLRCRTQALCADALHFGGGELPRDASSYTGFVHIHGLEFFVVHVEYIRNLLETEEFVANPPRRVVGQEAHDTAEILVETKYTQFGERKGGDGSLPLLHKYVDGCIEQERVIALGQRILCVRTAYVHGIRESEAPMLSSRDLRGLRLH